LHQRHAASLRVGAHGGHRRDGPCTGRPALRGGRGNGLRHPGDRLAHFIASFGGDDLDQYRVVGTKGQIEVSPGYRFDRAITIRLTRGGETVEKTFPRYDQFSGQAAYFADCVLKGVDPEPDGGDGLADVVIMRAIEESAKTGRAQKITLPERPSHPSQAMARDFPVTDKRLML